MHNSYVALIVSLKSLEYACMQMTNVLITKKINCKIINAHDKQLDLQ